MQSGRWNSSVEKAAPNSSNVDYLIMKLMDLLKNVSHQDSFMKINRLCEKHQKERKKITSSALNEILCYIQISSFNDDDNALSSAENAPIIKKSIKHPKKSLSYNANHSECPSKNSKIIRSKSSEFFNDPLDINHASQKDSIPSSSLNNHHKNSEGNGSVVRQYFSQEINKLSPQLKLQKIRNLLSITHTLNHSDLSLPVGKFLMFLENSIQENRKEYYKLKNKKYLFRKDAKMENLQNEFGEYKRQLDLLYGMLSDIDNICDNMINKINIYHENSHAYSYNVGWKLLRKFSSFLGRVVIVATAFALGVTAGAASGALMGGVCLAGCALYKARHGLFYNSRAFASKISEAAIDYTNHIDVPSLNSEFCGCIP